MFFRTPVNMFNCTTFIGHHKERATVKKRNCFYIGLDHQHIITKNPTVVLWNPKTLSHRGPPIIWRHISWKKYSYFPDSILVPRNCMISLCSLLVKKYSQHKYCGMTSRMYSYWRKNLHMSSYEVIQVITSPVTYPSVRVVMGKGSRDSREDWGMPYETWGFPGTYVRGVQEWQLDKAVHCCCGQRGNCLHGVRGQRLCALLEELILG